MHVLFQLFSFFFGRKIEPSQPGDDLSGIFGVESTKDL